MGTPLSVPTTFHRLRCPRWLLAAVLALCALNLVAALGTAANAAQFQALAVPFSPTPSVAISGMWAVLFAALFRDLLRRRGWAFRWMAPLVTLYGVTEVLWQIAFFRSDYDRGRLGFQVLITAAALIPAWWVALRHGWLRAR